jgi:hypothetical protein
LNSPNDRVFISKDPRALPDDVNPKLILAAVRPGRYRMTRAEVSHDAADFNMTPKNSREFEVVAGQVTYLGSILLAYASRYEGKYSVLTPSYFQMVVKSDFERDVQELKSLDKRSESVVLTSSPPSAFGCRASAARTGIPTALNKSKLLCSRFSGFLLHRAA